MGRKPAWKKFTEVSKRAILWLSATHLTLESVPTKPANSFLEFMATGSTTNTQMLFAHMSTKKKCKAYPAKRMVTPLFGGILLPLDDSQGLGFNIFGLSSSASAEAFSEYELLQNQINAIDRQGVSKEGVERMTETRLSFVYTFTDLWHRFKSLLCGYKMITEGENYFTKMIVGCCEMIDALETKIIRIQNKRPQYMTKLVYI